MRHVALAALLAALGAAAGADAATTGCVVSVDGTPIAGAKVEVIPAFSYADELFHPEVVVNRAPITSALADAAGRYVIEQEVDPREEIVISAEGYASVLCQPEEARAVVMIPAPMVSGQVTVAGKPVAGAVVIWRGGVSRGWWATFTDGEGIYRAPDPSLWALLGSAHHAQIGHSYYFVRSSDNEAINLNFKLESLATATGKVVDDEGKPVEGADIKLLDVVLGTSSVDGMFAVRVPPMEARLEIAHRGAVGAASGGSGAVVVKLEPGRTFRGRVVDEAGAPVGLAAVEVSSRRVWREVRCGADGMFEVSGLMAGSYWLEVTARGFDSLNQEVDLEHAATVKRDLVLLRSVSVAGRVTDPTGSPVAGALVYPLEESRYAAPGFLGHGTGVNAQEEVQGDG